MTSTDLCIDTDSDRRTEKKELDKIVVELHHLFVVALVGLWSIDLFGKQTCV